MADLDEWGGFGVEIPFVHHLGFGLSLFEGGFSELHYDPKPEHLNSFAVTHGGALMTLLDVTMAVAAPSWAPIVSFSLLIVMLLFKPGKHL